MLSYGSGKKRSDLICVGSRISATVSRCDLADLGSLHLKQLNSMKAQLDFGMMIFDLFDIIVSVLTHEAETWYDDYPVSRWKRPESKISERPL